MDYFTLVVGVLTVVGFIIQIRDIFPKFAETRKTALLLSAGLLAGLITGSFSRYTTTPAEIHVYPLVILIVTMGLFAYLLWVAVRYADYRNNKEGLTHLGELLGGGLICFTICLITLGISFRLTSPSDQPEIQLTNREYLELARFNEAKEMNERALYFLRNIGRPLNDRKLYVAASYEHGIKPPKSPFRKEIERIESKIESSYSESSASDYSESNE